MADDPVVAVVVGEAMMVDGVGVAGRSVAVAPTDGRAVGWGVVALGDEQARRRPDTATTNSVAVRMAALSTGSIPGSCRSLEHRTSQ